MARPIKKGLEYFPFDVGFFSDKKVKILKSRYGADGIVIYQYLLCEIYKENGYFLVVDEDFEYIISDDLNMESDKVKQVLNFLLKRSLFDDTLFQSDKVLTSAGIQKRYQEAVKARASKKSIIVDNYWLLSKEETASYIKVTHFSNKSKINDDKSWINSSLSVEKLHKEKESKEKESKENKKGAYFGNQELDKAFNLYLMCRRNNNDEVKGEQIRLLIEQLQGLSTDVNEQIAIVNKATMSNWKSFYPLKKKPTITTGRPKNAKQFESRGYNHKDLTKKALENSMNKAKKIRGDN